MCSPPCGAGYLCTSGGACVREVPAAPPPPQEAQTWRTSTNQCQPSCRTGYTCVSGQCVSACNPACPMGQRCTPELECVAEAETPKDSAEPAAAPLVPSPSSKDSIVNVHIDVLGALQFGVTPTIEVGKRVSGYLRLRPFNSGVASYFLLGRDSDDELHWGLGGALGLHVFSKGIGNMRGLFGGPALEYAFVKTRDLKSQFASYRDHVLIPQLDFGNRWVFDTFLLAVGARVGVWVPVRSRVEAIGTGSSCVYDGDCKTERSPKFAASVFLDLGWFL